MYTASLYASLVSFLCKEKDLLGKKLGMFSYGSGLVASFFSMTVKNEEGEKICKISMQKPS
jgi:hydroxymethylglutaryl-CoA synthase